MTDLDMLLRRVEPLTLADQTRRAHLAELIRTQSTLCSVSERQLERAGSRPREIIVAGPVRVRRSTLAAGLTAAAVAAVAGGVWALTAAPGGTQLATGGPGTTQPISSSAPLKPVVRGTHLPQDTGAAGKAYLATAPAIQQLADILGLDYDRATSLANRLVELDRQGPGLDPRSAEFAAAATAAGVTPSALQDALRTIKMSAPAAAGRTAKSAVGKDGSKGQGTTPAEDGSKILASPEAQRILVNQLGVTNAQAAKALSELQVLVKGGDQADSSSTAFAKIARELGVTPGQLENALKVIKQSH